MLRDLRGLLYFILGVLLLTFVYPLIVIWDAIRAPRRPEPSLPPRELSWSGLQAEIDDLAATLGLVGVSIITAALVFAANVGKVCP